MEDFLRIRSGDCRTVFRVDGRALDPPNPLSGKSIQFFYNSRYLFSDEPITVIERKLDSCTVSVYPSLNPDHETMTLPENMVSQLGITAKVNKDGAVITGADVIYSYQQVRRVAHRIKSESSL